ncbi:ATP-binding protein [Halorussus marinus]|uniref:ATP-binding protein n=1 Tax=Halorussus marinus TaxID=2505976 RepID=UPI001092AEFA|nr:ATP-binding protein [Halorussus marinus]
MRWSTPSPAGNATLGGLGVAGVGFLLTRFTVTLAIYDEPRAFYLSGLVPLVLGLSLTAFGVALVVGPFDRAFVRTTTAWCLVGAGAMLLLVMLTVLGSNPDGVDGMAPVLSETYLSNFLIGGSVGGTLTGVYAARAERRRRQLRSQANRLVTLNRILRHEVLNAVTVIGGYADAIADRERPGDERESADVIRRRSDHIVDTIEDVEYLTETGRSAGRGLEPVGLATCLRASVESVRAAYPDAEYALAVDPAEGVEVWANERLDQLFENLIENAVAYDGSDRPRVEIDATVGGRRATVRIADDGPGLPARHREILEDGAITDHDDPSSGFGLNAVRLLAERFHGDVHTTVTDDGTTIEVTLVRASRPAPASPTESVSSYGVSPSELTVAVGASVLAGGAMGVFNQLTGGSIPVIGALYGVANPLVGWITHEFHSVVFGMIYAAMLAVVPERYGRSRRGRLLVGAGWGAFLWAFAAGVVMPTWLRLVGISAPLPNLAWPSLASHLVWGLGLGLLYSLGTEWFGSDTRPWPR